MKSDVAYWAFIINSTIWAASSSPNSGWMSVVWLIGAFVSAVIEYVEARAERMSHK